MTGNKFSTRHIASVMSRSGILASSYAAVGHFLDDVASVSTSIRVLERPCILLTADVHQLDEHAVLCGASSRPASELAILDPWAGMSEAMIAKLLLSDPTETFTSLMLLTMTLGVRRELGESPSRNELSVEHVEGFVAKLYDRTFGGAAE